MKRLLLSTVMVLATVSYSSMRIIGTSASAQVQTFTDLNAFNMASTTTLEADFEGLPVAPATIPSPLVQGRVIITGARLTTIPVGPSNAFTEHGNEDFDMTFSGDAPTAVGFDVYTNGFGPPSVTITVFDTSDTLIGTFPLAQPLNTAGFFGVTSGQPIGRIHWLANHGEITDTAMDNVRVGGSNTDEFTINFATFIPGNSITGPPQSRCGRGEQLFFAGDDRGFDPTASSFRTRQLVTVITEESIDADGLKDGTDQNFVGETKSYAPDALPTIDAADDDGVLQDCHLLHDRATTSNGDMHVVVTRTDPHQVTVHLLGGAANPLVHGSPEINWDFTVTIDTSGANPHWTLQGVDDGFPAFEIYINDNSIYTRNAPPPYTLTDLRRLLPRVGDVLVSLSGDLP